MNTEDTAFIMLRFADGTPGQFVVSKAANGHKTTFASTFGVMAGMEWAQEEYGLSLVARVDMKPYI